MVLDFIGGVILTATVVVNVNALVTALPVSRAMRLALAAFAGLWVGLQVALYQAGAFQAEATLAFPLVGLMVALPPLAVALAAAASPAVRQALLALPLSLLVGLNALRLVGLFFVLLAAGGRLDGPFPHVAGWGDVAVAALAVPLALRVARGTASPAAIAGWNAFGAADLLLAVALGTLSSQGFALQIFHGAQGSAAVQHMPWLLIPTVLVPFYLVTHAIVLARLRRERLAGAMPA